MAHTARVPIGAAGIDREIGTWIRTQHAGLVGCPPRGDTKDTVLEHVPRGHDDGPTVPVDHSETHGNRLSKESQDLLLGQNARLRIDCGDLHEMSSRPDVPYLVRAYSGVWRQLRA